MQQRRTVIEDTTPVGIFPDGVSPCGCPDKIGNVLELRVPPHEQTDRRLVRRWFSCGGVPARSRAERGAASVTHGVGAEPLSHLSALAL
jgi:hypothetical protein